MNEYDVYGIGNALVDTEFQVSDGFLAEQSITKGHMTLIDLEEKNRLVQLLSSQQKPVKHSSGGSAGNTVAAVAQFGDRAYYSCMVGRDQLGDMFLADMDRIGVTTSQELVQNDGPTGQCLVMITPDAERTMTSYLGITDTISAAQLVPASIKKSRFLYMEGYLVGSDTGFETLKQAQAIAMDAGVRVVMTLSDPSMATFFRDRFAELIRRGVDLLFCNAEEAMILSAADDVQAAARALRGQTAGFAITLGAEGALVWDGKEESLVPAPFCEPVDTNGAGDMFAGAFLYALNRQETYAGAALFANLAASRLVCRFGPRLPEAEYQEILGESHLA